ncbi:PREDICTED: nuclear factor erythroid 2-related factor 1-like [Nanorana parkeri]|uniref:nuclear factor erythroid 2-related factor 1-like n=1 Tax=Nanorana parkeri TaxID=125878 RepID=UPI000854A635|nr:PREDICTED: nuclear factor erythroid 2-related factor 1-like [Nanorana parkeri]
MQLTQNNDMMTSLKHCKLDIDLEICYVFLRGVYVFWVFTFQETDPIDILWLQDIDLGAGREDFESRQHLKDHEEVWESLGDNSESEEVEHRLQVDGETGENVPQEGQTAMSLAECLSLLDDTFQFDSPEFPAPDPTNILDTEPDQTDLQQTDGLLSPFLPDIETPLDLEEQWQDLMSLMDMQPMDMNSSAEDPLYLSMDPSLQQNEDIHQTAFQGCSQNMSLYSPTIENFPIPESPLLQLSSHNSTDLNSTFGFTNFSGILFPSLQNSTANVTATNVLQDPLSGILDEALLDEISLMELAMEEGFSQMQASQLKEELDSDSGLSLDSHRSPVSPSGSETSSSSSSCSSSSSFSEEGAVGYSSDSEMVEPEESEESIDYQPEYSKFCRMSSEDPSRFQRLLFLEHVGHNHTYNMVPEEPEEQPQPAVARGNRRTSGFEDSQAGRDEQRARAMKIPFSNDKIINMPVEEFNELLTKYQLTEAQLCLVRDIRRRGKNKMAAQNCRKRKLDTILNLEQEVKRLSRQRNSQLREKGENLRSLQRMKQEVESLYQEVFSQLRDQEGRPYSPQGYALHYTNNDNIVLMPRNAEGQQSRRSERKDRRK